jgi:serine/threonine protein kinase
LIEQEESRELIEEEESGKLLFSREPDEENIRLSDFEILNMIGKGSISNVFLIKKKSNGEPYAMKSIRKDLVIEGNLIDNTKLEKDILLKVSHS